MDPLLIGPTIITAKMVKAIFGIVLLTQTAEVIAWKDWKKLK